VRRTRRGGTDLGQDPWASTPVDMPLPLFNTWLCTTPSTINAMASRMLLIVKKKVVLRIPRIFPGPLFPSCASTGTVTGDGILTGEEGIGASRPSCQGLLSPVLDSRGVCCGLYRWWDWRITGCSMPPGETSTACGPSRSSLLHPITPDMVGYVESSLLTANV
jgi:hypothetical protein